MILRRIVCQAAIALAVIWMVTAAVKAGTPGSPVTATGRLVTPIIDKAETPGPSALNTDKTAALCLSVPDTDKAAAPCPIAPATDKPATPCPAAKTVDQPAAAAPVASATGRAEAPGPAISAADAFALLKTLAGEWAGTMGDTEGGPATRISYKVIAAGSVLAETIFPGAPHEMITVYHMDGERLIMTHYCAAGNQPRLALTGESTKNCLKFDFTGATNMKSDQDQHMHSLRIYVIDADHLKTEWDGYKDGRKVETAIFRLTRSK